jgi:predicted MFS family arabinose efflux permease
MKTLFKLYKSSFSNLQRNIWILSIAMFINRSGSMVLLFASLFLTNNLHFSIAQAGIVLSFYGIGSVLGSYAGGWLTDRKNYFDIMFWSLIISGLVLLFMLVARSQFTISTIIFTYAFVSDMFRPANSTAIAAFSSSENRTRSVSLVRLAVNLGFTVGPAVGGFVAMHLGYKLLFVIDAFTSFGAAIMLYRYLPKQILTKKEESKLILKDSSTSAYRDYTYLLFILLVALYGISFFQIFASVPQYFSKECNYNEATIGLLLALNGALVVIIEMPFVTALSKYTKVFPFIIAGSICIPIAFFILNVSASSILIALLFIVVITMSEILAMPFMMNYSLSRSHSARQGQYSALYSISYGIANIVAPSLGLGIAAAFGFSSMFYFFMALGCTTTLGFFYLNKKNKSAN